MPDEPVVTPPQDGQQPQYVTQDEWKKGQDTTQGTLGRVQQELGRLTQVLEPLANVLNQPYQAPTTQPQQAQLPMNEYWTGEQVQGYLSQQVAPVMQQLQNQTQQAIAYAQAARNDSLWQQFTSRYQDIAGLKNSRILVETFTTAAMQNDPDWNHLTPDQRQERVVGSIRATLNTSAPQATQAPAVPQVTSASPTTAAPIPSVPSVLPGGPAPDTNQPAFDPTMREQTEAFVTANRRPTPEELNTL